MKRFFRILFILIVVVVGAMVVVPIVFKDEIIAKVKEEANKNLEATVDFESVSINLFSRFPNFSFSLDELTVDGKGEYEGIRLLSVDDLGLELDLMSVISGSSIQIEGISVSGADLRIMVDEEGNANYDIVAGTDGEEELELQDPESSSNFKLELKKYSLEDINLTYNDRQLNTNVLIRDLDHTGRGDFSMNEVNLKTQTSIAELDVDYEEVAYLTNAVVEAKTNLKYLQDQVKAEFQENTLTVNELPLHFEGSFAMPGDAYDMDLTFNSPEASFKSLLSLIPAIYTQEFKDLKSSGELQFDGYVKGVYDDDNYPAFGLNLKMDEGNFNYPDLPAGVNSVNIDAHIENRTSNLDGTVVDIKSLKAKIADNPLNMRLYLATPMSNPQFDFALDASLDLANIQKVVPSEGLSYSGTLNSSVAFKGDMKKIENERYEEVEARGEFNAQDLLMEGDSLPYAVSFPGIKLSISPQKADLESFSAKIGQSDFSANGIIDNIIGYALTDEKLSGKFSLQSNRIDLNELAGSEEVNQPEEESDKAADTALSVVRVPENINFDINASVDTLIYDNLQIKKMRGNLQVANGEVALKNTKMYLLDGALALSGKYDSKPAAPLVDFDLNIDGFSFQESYANLTMVQKYAPIMKSTEGTYSAGFNFESVLNPDMTPDLASVYAQGSLLTSYLRTEPKALKELSATLQNPKLGSLSLNPLDIDFEIKDGRIEVDTFNIRAGNIRGDVAGTSGLDQTLDYVMDMQIPARGIGVQDMLSKLGASSGGMVNLKVNIGGTVSNPKVSTSLGNMVDNITKNLKDKAEKKVQDVKKQVEDEIAKKRQQMIAEAERKGDQLIAEAEKRAQQIRNEAARAAQKIRDEADQKAKKLINEAGSNPLKKKAAEEAAKRIRREADEKAKKIEQEADKKAQDIVEAARKQKKELVQKAQNYDGN